MAQPYVGEIRLFAGTFAPAGWWLCDGTPLPISEYEVLFQLIGTTYGGDGESVFKVPDLRGRVPLHQGTLAGVTSVIGEQAGTEEVTLSLQQIPNHSHPLLASTGPGTGNAPGSSVLAASASLPIYIEDSTDSNLAASSVSAVGGNQPHENMQPFAAMNYIISLFGIFPSPT